MINFRVRATLTGMGSVIVRELGQASGSGWGSAFGCKAVSVLVTVGVLVVGVVVVDVLGAVVGRI